MTLKYALKAFAAGAPPRTPLPAAGGAHDASPDPLVGWGGGTPSPHPTSLGPFGASILAPSTLASRRLHLCPHTKNPAGAQDPPVFFDKSNTGRSVSISYCINCRTILKVLERKVRELCKAGPVVMLSRVY